MGSSSKLVKISSSQESDADSETSSNGHVASPASRTSRSVNSEQVNLGHISSVFSDDILPMILDNLQILSPKDLLRFRLVNRCWRDAATSVLLKRNACDIALEVESWYGDDSGEHILMVNEQESTFRYYSAGPRHSHLPELIQLITTSPKFPSNSIKFLPGCEMALKNLGFTPALEDHRLEQDELMKLFSLYGKKIKKLSFFSKIQASSVQNLLFVHLPNLTCLDLRNFEQFGTPSPPPQGQEEVNQNHVFDFPPWSGDFTLNANQLLKLEVIYSETGDPAPNEHKTKFLGSIINASPNLRCIKGVSILLLAMLIKMRKAHLAKCLRYNPVKSRGFLDTVLGLEGSFLSSSVKLSELTVKFTHIKGYPAEYGRVTQILNTILKGSKDSLEYLELHVNPEDFLVNIQIPPMRNLKCLKLVKAEESFGQKLQTSQAREERMKRMRAKIPVDWMVYDLHVFQFENENQENPNRIPPDYFPALSKVVLDVDPSSLNTYNKLLAFFALEHVGVIDQRSVVSGDILPSVTTLKMTTFPHVSMALGKLFPNVSHLQIQCEHGTEMINSVWEEFPKLERIGIYNYIPRGDPQCGNSFFTGIHRTLCTKFTGNNAAAAARLEFSPEQIHYLRTQPSIRDCANLKELTIGFKDKITRMFVSRLTGLYAFQGIVHKTKIIFSFESVDLNEAEKQEIRMHLEPVAAYIEIRV